METPSWTPHMTRRACAAARSGAGAPLTRRWRRRCRPTHPRAAPGAGPRPPAWRPGPGTSRSRTWPLPHAPQSAHTRARAGLPPSRRRRWLVSYCPRAGSSLHSARGTTVEHRGHTGHHCERRRGQTAKSSFAGAYRAVIGKWCTLILEGVSKHSVDN